MINWGASVVQPVGGDQWGMLCVQPETPDTYDALFLRLRRARCKLLAPREYEGALWPTTSCTVTIQPVGDVPTITELHTGASRLIPTGDLWLPPLFVEAAGRGRVLLALLKPGTLPAAESGVGIMPAQTRDLFADLVEAAVGRREVLAGLAVVLDRPAPKPGAARGRRP